MRKTKSMNIRIDEETRRELKNFAEEVGMPASALVNASIREMLRNQSVTLSAELEPTPYLENLIKEAEADYKAGKNITRTKNKEELEAFLDSI